MVKKKNLIRNVLIVFLFSIILVLLTFGSLQTFVPFNNGGYKQYFIDQSDYGIAGFNGDYFVSLGGRSGQQVGTQTNPPQNTNSLVNSVLTNTVTINNGVNTYQFISQKTGQAGQFGLNPNSYYCWQKVDVMKNGQLVDTWKSWGDDNNIDSTKNFFQGHDYEVFDDSSESTGIRVRMSDIGESSSHAVFFGNCRVFVNNFQLIYSNETFDIDIEIPEQTVISGENISVLVNVDNTLTIPVEVDFNAMFSLGGLSLNEQRTTMINPGMNQIEFSIPAIATLEEIDVDVEGTLRIPGSSLQGLNFGYGTVQNLGECIGTTGSGDCDNWKVRSNSGANPEIQSNSFVDVGTLIATNEQINIMTSPTEPGSEEPLTLTTTQSRGSGTTTVTNNPPISNTNFGSTKISQTLIITIAIIGFLIIIFTLRFGKRKKKK